MAGGAPAAESAACASSAARRPGPKPGGGAYPRHTANASTLELRLLRGLATVTSGNSVFSYMAERKPVANQDLHGAHYRRAIYKINLFAVRLSDIHKVSSMSTIIYKITGSLVMHKSCSFNQPDQTFTVLLIDTLHPLLYVVLRV